ncbi:MAG: hypothetical protein ABI743_07760, partial [bacterium]
VTSFDPNGNWVWGWSGENGERGCSVLEPTFRPNGNLAIAGYISTPTDFDPGPGTTLVDAGRRLAGYKAHFTSTGALVEAVAWTNVEPTDGAADAQGFREAADGAEWVIGSYSGAVDLDPGPGTALETVDLFADHIYLSHFASNDTLTWHGTFDNQGAANTGPYLDGMAVDSTGGLVVAGYVPNGQSADLDPAAGTSLVTGTTLYGEAFWTRLTPAGASDWVRHQPYNSFPAQFAILPSNRLLFYYSSFIYPQAFDTTHTLALTGSPVLVSLQSDGTW